MAGDIHGRDQLLIDQMPWIVRPWDFNAEWWLLASIREYLGPAETELARRALGVRRRHCFGHAQRVRSRCSHAIDG